MLQITVDALAEKAQVSPNTISRYERGEGAMRRATVAVIEQALKELGVVFDGDDGVRLTGATDPE